MANALLSTIHMLGMDDVDQFGNSTGTLSMQVSDAAATQGRSG
jgi:hypothetical protein